MPVALILLVFAVDVAIYATVDAWPLLALWTMVGARHQGPRAIPMHSLRGAPILVKDPEGDMLELFRAEGP